MKFLIIDLLILTLNFAWLTKQYQENKNSKNNSMFLNKQLGTDHYRLSLIFKMFQTMPIDQVLTVYDILLKNPSCYANFLN